MNGMKFFWGLVILTLGVLILGATAGWWTSDVWITFLSFWPLILIVLGLKMIINNKNLLSLIILFMVLGAIFMAFQVKADWTRGWEWFDVNKTSRDVTTSSVAEKYDKNSVKDMDLSLNVGAAELYIDSLSSKDGNNLYTATATNIGPLENSLSINGSTARAKLSQKDNNISLFNPSNWKDRALNTHINPDIPTKLSVDSGASSLKFNLSGLRINLLDIKAGASSGEIKFGSLVDSVEANIDMGASGVKLVIPKETGLKILTNSGLTKVSFIGNVDITKNDEGYISSNYETSKKKIRINISSGASSIEISRY